MRAVNIFKKEETQRIIQAIRDAENETSGEIRLHIESRCKGDTLQRAVQVFKRLKMHETKLHNGTLIYLATNDRKFAIFGDEGINKVVPDNFWDDVKEEMGQFFKKENFADGISRGIYLIGEKLKEFFPYQEDDINELPNDISLGK